jgi:membrane-bound lytic murein transglycosylase D
VFFSRLFLLAFSAIIALAPTLALSADEGPVLSTATGAAVHADETLVLNGALTVPLKDSIPAPPLSAAVPAPSTPSPDPTNINPTLIVDTSLAQNDLWQRIRNGFAMHELDSPLIARHEQWYASRPDYVARMMERSQRYLYFITEEVEKRGMPTEIALLPMIESAFNPGAYSIGSASGIWQFIPSTGRNFGLQQNWWYDGRRDIVNATKGALDYLQKLHDQFGDWELALAAYNWGEGAVERAQEHNRKRGLPTNYASLKMPDETRNYVPKLLAVKNIVSNPEKFGLALQSVPNQPYFTAVTTARHIDVKLAAKLANVSLEEFIALNPAHNRPVILQENADVLLLPVDKAETFRANLESYNEPLVSWQAYRSKKGERLDKVAPRFGLSVEKLKSINGLSPRAKLSNGQSLLVPLNGEDADNEFEAFNTHLMPSDKPLGRTIIHTVKKGETLNTISHHYHVSVGKLQSLNNISHLKSGQTIIIARSGRPHHVAKAGRNHIRLVSAKGKKHLERKPQHRMHVAYNR